MLRHRVKSLVKRAAVTHPPPLPPEQLKRITLPDDGRNDMPPGRYRISDSCELVIVPADATGELEAAVDTMPEGRPCG